MFTYITNRMKERSTWIGLISVATLFGWKLDPAGGDLIVQVGVGIASLIGIFTQDKK